MNLGSPDSTSVPDVRRYLNEFLMDGRVIDVPFLWRTILVKGIITLTRAPKSAEAYRSIWTKDGSPLVHITRQVQEQLSKQVSEPVQVAMRYGNPAMKVAFDNMAANHPDVEEVILLPMYPHYAMSSFETAVVHAEEVYKAGQYKFKIASVPPFYDHPAYIHALSESIRPNMHAGAHLLFSYHSIPERHINKSDVTGNHCLKVADCCHVDSPAHKFCYRHQCYITTELVAKELGLSKNDYSVSFQSKLGRSAWLTPGTTARMEQMPGEGIKDLLVVCPSFVSDCLETLEEVDIRERENFLKAGGEKYKYIPCINIQPLWIKAIIEMVNEVKA